MSKVLLKDICKSYGDLETVKNVDLTIEDKEFIVLVGPSGCGKTTILRMIAGLEDITSGELSIGDRVVNNVEPKDRNIAMVFQSYALYPHKNVYENMAFGLRMRKFAKEDIDQRVRKAAEILHITEYLDRKPKQLSGGQRQRVALGRAIVRDPEVFLMDEPLSNLDAKLRVQMRSELIKLHSELKTTFIYVTHDQVEAMTMGDRIVIVNEGRVQQVDKPENIYNNPANIFVASFIGSPPMNFITGMVTSSRIFKAENYEISVSEKMYDLVKSNDRLDSEIILGIRPEHFIFGSQNDSHIDVKVNLVEMLGSEKLLHFNIGTDKVTAKLESEVSVEKDSNVSLSFNMNKAVLFDPDTTKTLV